MHHVKIKTERPDLETPGARSRLDDALKGLLDKTERERPSARLPQHRRKKRKEMDEAIPESNQHKQNAYIIKLFDRSVDLAQFNTSTPLYPICRAWMRNNPSVRLPPASPSPPHIMVEEELTDMINGKGTVYRLPPPTSCPISTSGEPINLRIPQTEKPTVNKVLWKECSNKNQLRYSESIRVLKEMKELYDR
ncbi:Protein lin-37 [Liparis tanakae]|uniref:Protein lin-37 n=1 Tax=Liparis tanakae TaxID=230148 RepID=A0A4Z2HR53_9TELE|nr:Protein lin-37 [Liparis tanakae]